MDEESKHIIKMEIWISSVAILFAVFFYFNSSSRIMNSNCDGPYQGRSSNNCSPIEKPMNPILD